MVLDVVADIEKRSGCDGLCYHGCRARVLGGRRVGIL